MRFDDANGVEGSECIVKEGRISTASVLRRTMRRVTRPSRIAFCAGLVLLVNAAGAVVLQGDAGATGLPISGTGSSFASPAIEEWIVSTHADPYDLPIQYSASNSGTGRFEFTNQTTDFGVTDIGYAGNTDTTPPSFPFDFVPLVGEGIAFFYNVPGLTQQLQLTSFTACAILTGGITNWDDSQLAATNPGVTLPNLPIVPVTESDSAVTNLAMEQWCIAEQPALWAAFVNSQDSQPGGPTDGVVLSATTPYTNWPGIKGGLDNQATFAVAADVETTPGAIGAVQPRYAQDEGAGSPGKNVALVQNASGDFTLPNSLDVTSALAYATPQANGLQDLNFDGLGPNVYNPSTFSYLLTPTMGWPAAKGEVMSTYINYALTLGQKAAPSFGYATLGQPLEHFGIQEVASDVPGAVPMTAEEQAFYDCGDLTPTDVAAGNSVPSCSSSPGNGLPEAPYAVGLPVIAMAAFGGVFLLRRRRIPSVAT
jgi:phosphate transport system substrate-binding protein